MWHRRAISVVLPFPQNKSLCKCHHWSQCRVIKRSFIMGLRHMTHKLSSACAEMILGYHLLLQQFFFTHNWNLSRHCCVVVCFCMFFLWFVFCLCFVFCAVFAFVLWSFVFRFLFFQRDKVIGLCIGPLPVDFCGPTAWPLRELVN